MKLPHAAGALAALILASWAWSQRHAPWVTELLARWEPVAPVHIRFDNGTVRQPPVPASGPDLAGHATGLKKCVGPDRALYTDGFCPPGTQVAAIKNGTVNVVGPNPQAASAPAGPAPAQRSAVLPWMAAGGGSGPSLQEQRMDAAVNR